MKKNTILLLSFFMLLIACNRDEMGVSPNQPVPTVAKGYLLYDSVFATIHTMDTLPTTYTHYPISRSIQLLFATNQDFFIYNSDTFRNSGSDYGHGSSFPRVNFKKDTIVFSYKLGGIGTQQWKYIYGKQQ